MKTTACIPCLYAAWQNMGCRLDYRLQESGPGMHYYIGLWARKQWLCLLMFPTKAGSSSVEKHLTADQDTQRSKKGPCTLLWSKRLRNRSTLSTSTPGRYYNEWRGYNTLVKRLYLAEKVFSQTNTWLVEKVFSKSAGIPFIVKIRTNILHVDIATLTMGHWPYSFCLICWL